VKLLLPALREEGRRTSDDNKANDSNGGRGHEECSNREEEVRPRGEEEEEGRGRPWRRMEREGQYPCKEDTDSKSAAMERTERRREWK